MLTPCNRAIQLAAALVCSSLVATPTSGDKIKRTVPLSAAAWTVDLRQYGWPQTYFPYRLWAFHTSDLFLNNNELMATTVTHWPVEGLQRRSDPHHQYPYTLHAVVLNAASGRPLMTYSWGSDYQQMGIVPREDGSFAVFLGDRIDFYNAGLTPSGELTLPMVTDLKNFDSEGFISFSYSPTGKTMLVQYDDANGPACVLVQGETISQIRPVCEPPAMVHTQPGLTPHLIGAAVSDADMATTTGNDLDAMRVRIQTFQGPQRDLYHGRVRSAQFVTDETLLVWDWRSFRLIAIDGTTLWQQQVAPLFSEYGYLYSYTRNDGLIAVPVQDAHGPTVLSGVVVYDTLTHKQLFRVNTDPTINQLMGLSISPDGKRLALDSNRFVRSYNLPAKTE